jgi:amidase
MDDPIYRSAIELAQAIRSRRLSAVELTRASFARIAEVNPALNAVVQQCEDRAIAEARRADDALARGDRVGPLHGVPMTIKDSFETEGVTTAAGTTGLAANVPARDATVVARLRRAGAILLGKTNVPEITLRFVTDNYVYGRTSNPYDLGRIPGGSSGGAAAIVAAGGAAFDIGTDTGGSIRIPAHFCGLAGLKATAGRVPRTGHIPFLEFGPLEALTQAGPLARRVGDLLPILRIIAGPDAYDPSVVPMPIGDDAAVDIGNLRIAFYTDNGLMSPTPDTAAAVKAAVSALAARGAAVNEALPPDIGTSKALWVDLMTADGGAGVRDLLSRLGTERMHPLVEWTQEREAVPAAELMRALARWNDLRSRNLAFFEDFDLIVCPVNSGPATRHGEATRFDYTYHYNLLGWPVAVVRCGQSAEGLPIGVQVVARPWREHVAVAAAFRLEAELGGWTKPPL